MLPFDLLAAVDIGTNSVHLLIARVSDGHTFEIVDRDKEQVRLGSGDGGDMKRLEPEAMNRAVAALSRYRQLADSHGAPLRAVATSATREANNADEFIRRARDEAGVEIEVISGFEEARLIHLGVLAATPVIDKHLLVVDIGGGSTEIVVGRGKDPAMIRSLKLGAIRLSRRFFPEGVGSPRNVERARTLIDEALAPLLRVCDAASIEVAIGTSGTIEAVASIAWALRGEKPPRSFNQLRISRDDVAAVSSRLLEVEDRAGLDDVPGLDERRADIILAGTLILDRVLAAFGLNEIQLSEFALREGVLLDSIERARGSATHHLHDIRRQGVFHLAELCDEDPAHSLAAARLTLQLFDGLQTELQLSDDHRELLEAAALLANVGLFISHAGHHLHSYYVIRNSEHLLGYTDHEIELIAQVARYHRKSAPRKSHRTFAHLELGDQELVRRLAALLRLGMALNRSHSGSIHTATTQLTPETMVVTLEAPPEATLELELFAASERSGLLAEVLGREVTIVRGS